MASRQNMASVCDTCFCLFESQELLTQHKQGKCLSTGRRGTSFDFPSAETTRGRVVCGICSETFAERNSFNLHLAIHGERKPFVCEICCLMFSEERQLRDHRVTHVGTSSAPIGEAKDHRNITGAQMETGDHPIQEDIKKHSADTLHNTGHVHSHTETWGDEINYDTLSHTNNPVRSVDIEQVCKESADCQNIVKDEKMSTEGTCKSGQTESRQGEKEIPFKCLVCNELFDSIFSLEEHLHSHKGDKQSFILVQFNTKAPLETYNCTRCKALFRGYTDLEAHMNLHEGKMFQCNQCDNKYVSRKALERHLLRHNQPDCYQCEKCDESFAEKSQLKGHMLIHIKQVRTQNDDTLKSEECHGNLENHGEKLHQCVECDFTCRQKSQLKKHMHIHSNVHPLKSNRCGKSLRQHRMLKEPNKTQPNKARKFKCDKCDACFQQKSRLKIHIKSHNTEIHAMFNQEFSNEITSDYHKNSPDDQKLLKCQECSLGFRTKVQLSKHVMSKHCTERLFQCYQCGKAFKTSSKLKCHVRCVHSEERPFKCSQCNSSYKQKNELNRHVRSHSNDRPYLCTMCPWQFREQSMLRRHMQTHSTESHFQCPHCDKAFKQKLNLTSHLLTHSNEKPHQCVQCGKGFKRKTGLRNHMLVHTGAKPYKCNFCDQHFSQKSRIRVHTMRAHTGEKPHHCDICLKRFTTRWDLKLHGKQHQGVGTS